MSNLTDSDYVAIHNALREWFKSQEITPIDANVIMLHMIAEILDFNKDDIAEIDRIAAGEAKALRDILIS